MQQHSNIFRRVFEFIFYSNAFYGVCAVALSIEASLQQRLPLNSTLYYANVFLATVVFYIFPYVVKGSGLSTNPRTNWYTSNFELMKGLQQISYFILAAATIFFAVRFRNNILQVSVIEWTSILIFPLVGALYYGMGKRTGKYNLRRIGWLKPWIIGFTWSGIVTIYPMLVHGIEHGVHLNLNWLATLLFLKNFMFISILCILFDIKDYAVDYLARLRTFAVKLGVIKTIMIIVIPLTWTGLLGFLYYAHEHSFNQLKILLNIIPFILLAIVAWSLCKRRPLLYYLTIVDGLMLVKAILGTIAIKFF